MFEAIRVFSNPRSHPDKWIETLNDSVMDNFKIKVIMESENKWLNFCLEINHAFSNSDQCLDYFAQWDCILIRTGNLVLKP